MKTSILVLLLSVLLQISCQINNKVKNINIEIADKDSSILLEKSETDVKKIGNDSLVLISGKIYYTSSYCGGAHPTEEIMKELNKSKLYLNTEFRLFNEDSKIEYYFYTDNTGSYSLKLNRGNYNLYPTKIKVDENNNGNGYNPNCDARLKTILATINILESDSVINQNFNVHLECNPCDPYLKMRP
jgi:hypothetical protein